jgi:hypothetical protein
VDPGTVQIILLVVKSLGTALVVIMERSISVKPSCVDIRYVTKPTMLIAKVNGVLQSLFYFSIITQLQLNSSQRSSQNSISCRHEP